MLYSLDSSSVPDDCSFAPDQNISNSCPSSEWELIREFLALGNHQLPVKYQEIYQAEVFPDYFLVSGKESQRQQYLGQCTSLDAPISPIYGTAPMVATADALTNTSTLWFAGLNNVTQNSGHGSPLSDQSDSIHVLDGESLQAFTAGVCLSEVIQNTTDTNPVAFPFLYFANNPATPTVNRTSSDNYIYSAIVHPNISRANVLANASHPFEYQLRWVELPQPLFNGSSIGAIIVPPQAVDSTSDEGRPQSLTMCNLAAGWGTTTLQTETKEYSGEDSVSSRITNSIFSSSLQEPDHAPTPESGLNVIGFQYPGYPQLLINITQQWAQYLDPMVESANRSLFDVLIQERSVLPDNFDLSVSQTLVLMMTNGLARVGYESTLQGSPKSIPGTPFIDGNYWLSGKGNVFIVDPVESKDWVKFHVNSTLQGYAYNTQTLPPRLAIGVLTLYCIIALGHVIYSGITGRFPPTSQASDIFHILSS